MISTREGGWQNTREAARATFSELVTSLWSSHIRTTCTYQEASDNIFDDFKHRHTSWTAQRDGLLGDTLRGPVMALDFLLIAFD